MHSNNPPRWPKTYTYFPPLTIDRLQQGPSLHPSIRAGVFHLSDVRLFGLLAHQAPRFPGCYQRVREGTAGKELAGRGELKLAKGLIAGGGLPVWQGEKRRFVRVFDSVFFIVFVFITLELSIA